MIVLMLDSDKVIQIRHINPKNYEKYKERIIHEI